MINNIQLFIANTLNETSGICYSLSLVPILIVGLFFLFKRNLNFMDKFSGIFGALSFSLVFILVGGLIDLKESIDLANQKKHEISSQLILNKIMKEDISRIYIDEFHEK